MKCENCDGDGWVECANYTTGEPEQRQCELCGGTGIEDVPVKVTTPPVSLSATPPAPVTVSELSYWETEARRYCGNAVHWRERAEVAESALLDHGYRQSCDIAACNCGDQWYHGGHAAQRLAEIRDALSECVDLNGKTLLDGVASLQGEIAGANTELVRWQNECAALTAELAECKAALSGAVITMEAWADSLDKDPCNNDNYCKAKDTLNTLAQLEKR